jgi:hypothetical protein
MAIRNTLKRKEHALLKLQQDRDVWVATADGKGRAHLVPFSLYWDGSRVVVTTPRSSVSARNVLKSHQAKLALGDTRDVVILDVLVEVADVGPDNAEISNGFKHRNGWDPRDTSSPYVYFLMTPRRIQVWESEEELEGRDVMKKGQWLA